MWPITVWRAEYTCPYPILCFSPTMNISTKHLRIYDSYNFGGVDIFQQQKPNLTLTTLPNHMFLTGAPPRTLVYLSFAEK